MWRYAGLPQPTNIDRKQVASKWVEGGWREISHRNVTLGNPAVPRDYDREFPELRKSASEAVSNLAKDLEMANIDYVRCWFQWNFFQPNISSASYRFPLDDFVSKLKSKNIEIVAVLGNGYSRFLPVGIDENDPVGYLRSLAKASREIVTHYSNSIGVWQIENEPNWWFAHAASGWRRGKIWQTQGFQDSVLQTLHNIVGEESPSSTIAINLEADRKRTAWKSYSKYCDVIGIDFYPNYMKPLPIDVTGFALAADVKTQVSLPVFITETGYPSGPKLEGYNEDNQALYATEASQQALSLDALNGISIWRYSDSGWKSSPMQENYFGMKRKDGSPNPAWNSYAETIRTSKSAGYSKQAMATGAATSVSN